MKKILTLVIISLLLLSTFSILAPQVKAERMMILNPDFEQQLSGWSTSTGTATFTADASNPHSGSYSAKGVELNEGSLGRLYQDVTGSVRAGGEYKISGWIKTSNVVGFVVIALDYVATNGWTPADGYVKEIGYVSGTVDWTYYESGVFTLPPMPADATALWFLFDFNAGKGTAWWDDVSLIEVTPPPLIFNPGFEQELDGWSTSMGTATYVADPSNPRSGSYSAKGVELNEGSLGRLYQDMTGIVYAGGEYKISGWIKTQNVVGYMVIALDYVDDFGMTPADGYVEEIGYATGTTDWTYYESAVFTLPPMPSDASAVWFLFDFNAGKGTAWWDDVSLIEVTPPPEVPQKPIAELSASPTTVEVWEDVFFDASDSYDPDGTVVSYWFDFDDGFDSGWTSSSTYIWSYTDPGTYYAKAKVKDNDGLISDWSDPVPITVTPVAFTVSMSSSMINVQNAEYLSNFGTITFDDTTYTLPDSISKDTGSYTATGNPPNDYVFDHWQYSAGVSVSDENSQTTTVTISSDGDLVAVFNPKEPHLGLMYTYFPHFKFSFGEIWYPCSFYFDDDDIGNNPPTPGNPFGNYRLYYLEHGEYPPYYVYIHEVEDDDFLTIQYWMYYAYSDVGLIPLFHHPHDWDSTVYVVFDKENLGEPIGVYFFAHGEPYYLPWSNVHKAEGTNHPLVYVAKGTHAAYPREIPRIDPSKPPIDVWLPGGITLGPSDFAWTLVFENYLTSTSDPEISFSLIGYDTVTLPGYGTGIIHPGTNYHDGYWPNRFPDTLITGTADPAPWRRIANDPLWQGQYNLWDRTRPEPRYIKMVVGSPVDLHVYDPLNRHVGKNYETGEVEVQIPNAIYEVLPDGQYISLESPILGDYFMTLVGTGDGEYTFFIMFVAEGFAGFEAYMGEIVEDQVLVSEAMVSEEAMTTTPPLPTIGVEKIFKPNGVSAKRRGAVMSRTNITNTGYLDIDEITYEDNILNGWTLKDFDHTISVTLFIDNVKYKIPYEELTYVAVEDGTYVVYINFTEGVDLYQYDPELGEEVYVMTIYAFEPGWVLEIKYPMHPPPDLMTGDYEATVSVTVVSPEGITVTVEDTATLHVK